MLSTHTFDCLEPRDQVLRSTNVSQSITTPNYPNAYPPNAEYEWTFTAPEGEQVLFVVVGGRTETCCDKLEVNEKNPSKCFVTKTFRTLPLWFFK